MKKILAVLLAAVLLLALGTSAFAAAGDVELTIQGEKTGHNYEAYQIFSGIVAHGTLTEVQWGTGIDGDGLLAALKAHAVELAHPTKAGEKTTMAAQFATATTANNAAEIIKTWGNDSELLDTFAEIAGEHLTNVFAPSTEGSGNKYSFSLQPGYYLVKDEDPNADEVLEEDFYTKFLILLTDKTNAAVKGDIPTVTKKVSHNLSNNFGAAITNQLQKTHYYEWVGTMPSDLEDYEKYYYEFIDTLSSGLDFIRLEQIYIQHTGNTTTPIYDASKGTPVVNAGLMPEYKNDGQTFNVKWNDLLGVYPTLRSSDKVIVKYSAKLNANAVVGGTGNPNSVTLKFSNSPSDDGYGVTLPADPIVYTFKLEVQKQDEVSENPLKDAEFVLYHFHTKNGTDSEGNPTTENVPVYAKLVEGKVEEWTEDLAQATVLKTDDSGKLSVTGIQANLDYYLKETKAPTGYNKLTKDVKVMITGVTYSNDTVATITYSVDGVSKTLTDTEGNASSGVIPVTVNNRPGATLPSTGGVGTTMFYVIGGLMVAAALVLLVTKKRMGASN